MTGREIEVRLPVVGFCDRSYERPSHPQIQGQVVRNSPGILNKGPEQLPASARRGTEEGLIMDASTKLPEE